MLLWCLVCVIALPCSCYRLFVCSQARSFCLQQSTCSVVLPFCLAFSLSVNLYLCPAYLLCVFLVSLAAYLFVCRCKIVSVPFCFLAFPLPVSVCFSPHIHPHSLSWSLSLLPFLPPSLLPGLLARSLLLFCSFSLSWCPSQSFILFVCLSVSLSDVGPCPSFSVCPRCLSVDVGRGVCVHLTLSDRVRLSMDAGMCPSLSVRPFRSFCLPDCLFVSPVHSRQQPSILL